MEPTFPSFILTDISTDAYGMPLGLAMDAFFC